MVSLWMGRLRKWDEGEETHAEAKTSDEGKGVVMPDGNHRDVKGPIFGAGFFEDGPRATLVIMYPESLAPKLN